MTKRWTIKAVSCAFPDDDACLAHLFETGTARSPLPEMRPDRHLPPAGEAPAYTCNCGHHIHPMAGTPFERTRTPLKTWFYVMFLFCATRNGVTAKEIQRQIGVDL